MNELNTHNHDGVNSSKIPPYSVIPSYTMTTTQLATYLSRPAIEGDEFNVYNSTTSESLKYIRLNGVWTVVGTGNMIQEIGTSLPTASSNSGKYYYLTTTDTLYRSNGTAWIALN